MSRPRIRTPEEVFAVLREIEESMSYPPTVRELADLLDVSPATAMRYLRDLEQRGWITRWNGARGIRITKEGT